MTQLDLDYDDILTHFHKLDDPDPSSIKNIFEQFADGCEDICAGVSRPLGY